MVPDRLEDWTLQTLEALCSAGQSESDRHDFKFGLPDARGTTKICCAFANTFGGFLVIGIRDRREQFKIEGVEPSTELYGHLLNKIRADPDITVSPPRTIEVPGSSKLIYVFEIPRSSRRPHLPTAAEERTFWKRVGSDCEQMTLEEVRYQMNSYEEKREKIALLLIELFHIGRSMENQSLMPDGAYNGTIFSFDIIDRVVVESYSILKEEPNIFGTLDTLKNGLMMINAEKQKLLSIMSLSYLPEDKAAMINGFRDFVKKNLPKIMVLIQAIEQSIVEKFGVRNPYGRQ